MKKTITLFLAVAFTAYCTQAQNTFPSAGAAGIGTLSPNASSLLEINSTTKGFLPPRMTQAQRNAIASPAAGLMIYQTNGTKGLYYFNGSAWNSVSGANATLSNLSATSINQALLPKTTNSFDLGSSALNWRDIYFSGTMQTSGVRIMNVKADNTALGTSTLLLNSSGFGNTAIGNNALLNNTTAERNTATGHLALFSNTTGSWNAANGAEALYTNTSGYFNTANGFSALNKNTTGHRNTANGSFALNNNTTGTRNAATGVDAMFFNTDGSTNVANGFEALHNNTTGYSNVAIGADALYSNISASNLVAVGDSALYNNTAGSENVALGNKALYANTTGSLNTATGVNALGSNTTASHNTANGFDALAFNTTGDANSAIGYASLITNTTGSRNTASGAFALYTNSTGTNNTASGYSSLNTNSSGFNNTANGAFSLNKNTTGSYNIAVGANALTSNTTGSYNTATGSEALIINTAGAYNAAYGGHALWSNISGNNNTAIGNAALNNNESGFGNTAAGYNALALNTTQSGNTAIGYNAGATYINGINNTFVGTYADANNSDYYNSSALGYKAIVTFNNQVMLGNTSVNSIWGAGSYMIYSDGRFKKNINANVPGLDFIMQLRPVTYNYDIHKLNDYIQPDKISKGQPEEPGELKKINEDAITKKEHKLYTGFVAQEVEKAADKMNYEFSGLHKPENNKDSYGLSYADFVVPLVKAVQELAKQNETLISENKEQQKQIDELKALIVSTTLNTKTSNQSSAFAKNENAFLTQNAPNPFSNTTIIKYSVPASSTNAQIIITDNRGAVVKTLGITGKGSSQVTIAAGSLAAGNYFYTLYLNGKKADTRQMEIIK